MFRIKIITVGKIKRGPLREAVDELWKRLTPYARAEEVVVKKLTSELLQKQDVAIILSEDGTTYPSVEFAKLLPKWSEQGQRELTFIIAGPFGFDRSLLADVDHTLSLSPMTFPHELAYLVLLEQLYRAGTILAGKTYHY